MTKSRDKHSSGHPRSDAIPQIRLVLVSLLLTGILCPSLYQGSLDHLWAQLQRIGPYRWSSFETLWTVFWYGYLEVRMTVLFLKHPEWRFEELRVKDDKPVLRVRGMRRPSRRIAEIAIYIAPLLLMDLLMIKKFAGVSTDEILLSGNYDPDVIKSGNDSMNSFRYQSTFLIPTFHNITSSSPLQTRRALPAAAPSSRRLVLELCGSFLIYDALFFLFHLALHSLPHLRTYHSPHHRHDAQIHPQVTNQLSVFERLGLVLLANFSLNVLRSHVLTRTVFVPVFVWLLVELHSGMDLPLSYEKVLPSGWGGGARKHALHHRTGHGGYEPFFTWWDRLLTSGETNA